MFFFGISVLAGFLTVLAPCILPLLPVVIGTSEAGVRSISKRAVTVIASLTVSVIAFTLLLKASTLLIDVPPIFWSWFSGTIIILVGLAMLFPEAWAGIPLVRRLSISGNKALGAGYQKQSVFGDALVGVALGPVFSTCSPTYLFIIATVLPASLLSGLAYLFGFAFGLAVALLGIAYFGQKIVNAILSRNETAQIVKYVFGVLIVIVGFAILTGFDKKLEAFILDSGYGASILFENALIDRFSPEMGVDEARIEEYEERREKATTVYETITLAGGCFWCTEAYLQETAGVVEAVSGYAGGDETTASYQRVSKGDTAHKEAVQVTFDTSVVSLEAILDVFWSHIDPTDSGGQFADRGSQYKTAIFFHTPTQEKVVLDSKKRLQESELFAEPIATEIIPYTTFYEAEDYHQDYYQKASEHYERYKKASGRAGFVEETWAKDAAIAFLQSEQMKEKRDAYDYTPEEIEALLQNLDPLAYHVVAENGTESPFNNAYWDNKAEGIYVDVVTGKPLFSSTHKYDSGTGWPSFWRTIDDDSVTMHEDNSLSTTRTEIRSDAGHVGHVFEDGPVEEGGRRFCTNSASLLFVPKAEMESRGYGDYLYLFD